MHSNQEHFLRYKNRQFPHYKREAPTNLLMSKQKHTVSDASKFFRKLYGLKAFQQQAFPNLFLWYQRLRFDA